MIKIASTLGEKTLNLMHAVDFDRYVEKNKCMTKRIAKVLSASNICGYFGQ